MPSAPCGPLIATPSRSFVPRAHGSHSECRSVCAWHKHLRHALVVVVEAVLVVALLAGTAVMSCAASSHRSTFDGGRRAAHAVAATRSMRGTAVLAGRSRCRPRWRDAARLPRSQPDLGRLAAASTRQTRTPRSLTDSRRSRLDHGEHGRQHGRSVARRSRPHGRSRPRAPEHAASVARDAHSRTRVELAVECGRSDAQ